jgi:hypothetical protein
MKGEAVAEPAKPMTGTSGMEPVRKNSREGNEEKGSSSSGPVVASRTAMQTVHGHNDNKGKLVVIV